MLAPLAGIGNWFVRLQAKRYGAGLAVSEMVSSHAIHYGNRKTLDELLVIDERERAGGPVAIQLFGQDPEIMRSAAAVAAERGADLIDLNMGCPVPKVMKTGAGAALIKDPDTAVAVARAAMEGSGLPVTVKLRAALKPGGVEGFEVARRLVEDAGVAGLTFHPRSAAVRHKGTPDYELATRLVQELPVPIIVSGGMEGAEHIRAVFESTGCAAVMLARGALGNPWLFAQVLGTRDERAVARGDPRRVALGARPRRRAPRPGPRRPLPAQVPSLVRRAAGRGQGAPGGAAAGGHDRRAARRDRRACSPFWRPSAPATMRRRSARPQRAVRIPGPDFPRTTHAEGRHPHPRGTREAQAGDRAPLRHPPS